MSFSASRSAKMWEESITRFGKLLRNLSVEVFAALDPPALIRQFARLEAVGPQLPRVPQIVGRPARSARRSARGAFRAIGKPITLPYSDGWRYDPPPAFVARPPAIRRGRSLGSRLGRFSGGRSGSGRPLWVPTCAPLASFALGPNVPRAFPPSSSAFASP